MNWKKLSVILRVLSLSSGLFWHLSTIWTLYLTYPTNILIETDFQTDEREFPSLQFCATIPDKTRNRTSLDVFKEIDLKNIVVNISSLRYGIRVEELKSYSLNHTIESLSLRYYCFSFTDWFKQSKLSRQKSIQIQLNTINANGSWWMAVHHTLDIPSSYEWNQIELKKKQYYQVTYVLTSFYLLRSPYPTNCKNYFMETEFRSQKDCIRRCRRALMEDKCGFLSHEVDVYKREGSALFANTVNDEKCGQLLNSGQICGRMCSNIDCIKHYYKPIKIANRDHKQQYVEIDVVIPSEPFTTYLHRPQLETIEFLCYMASIFSLWFGFSFLSLFLWIKILVLRIKSISLSKEKSNERRTDRRQAFDHNEHHQDHHAHSRSNSNIFYSNSY